MKPLANPDNTASSSAASSGEKVFFHNQLADLKQSKSAQKNKLPEKTSASNGTHKAKVARPPGYTSWAAMKSRCDNPNHRFYDDYGARGISYDPSWAEFANFIRDMGVPPSPGHSLDRINPDGDYEKDNCRWATKKEQARNRRTTRRVDYEGKNSALADLAEEHGLPPAAVSRRILQGYSLRAALTTPVKWGGPREEGSRRSEHNTWPPSLTEESKAKLEAQYRDRIKPELTRPQYFLDCTYRYQQNMIENYWSAPPDQRPEKYETEATKLEKARDQASELQRLLEISEAK